MARSSNNTNQRQRSRENPLILGNFSELSLRVLHGTLGPLNQVGLNGYGGGTYNHWFQINLTKEAWIIVTKQGPRPNYIQTSVYDLNSTPIVGLPVFQADSIQSTNLEGNVYIPYLDTVASVQSDLYNTYSRTRLDRGDDRYYPLPAGSYLLCVSTTRNERLDYSVGLIVEFTDFELYLALEDFSELIQETTIDPITTEIIESPVTVDTVISTTPGKPNGFTDILCEINSGVTVTVFESSEWLIGFDTGSGVNPTDDLFILEYGDDYLNTFHDHALTDWKNAWEAQHHPDDKFPDFFVPMTNRP